MTYFNFLLKKNLVDSSWFYFNGFVTKPLSKQQPLPSDIFNLFWIEYTRNDLYF